MPFRAESIIVLYVLSVSHRRTAHTVVGALSPTRSIGQYVVSTPDHSFYFCLLKIRARCLMCLLSFFHVL